MKIGVWLGQLLGKPSRKLLETAGLFSTYAQVASGDELHSLLRSTSGAVHLLPAMPQIALPPVCGL